MMVVVGVTGYPFSGKSTFVSLVAKLTGHGTVEDRVVVKVPDKRLERLAQIYKPKKVTPLEIEVLEAGSIDPEDEKVTSRAFSKLQEVDTVLLVLRAFESPSVPPLDELPHEQLRKILDIFRQRDLSIIQGRIERLEGAKRKLSEVEEYELNVLRKVHEHFQSEGTLKGLELKSEEEKFIRGFSLMDQKPKVVLVNVGEEGGYEGKEKLQELAKKEGIELFEMNVGLASELLELDEEERKVFMEEYGLEGVDVEPLMRKILKASKLMTFFTAGEKEVRAWELKEGSTALDAAATIHTDIARGFIRAEVFSFEDIDREGSEKALKEKGLIRVVGKDYVVRDGDVIYIRFNV